MTNPLIRKLEHGACLTDEDRARLEEVCRRSRSVEARQDIIGEGDKPSDVHLVLSGMACRYKVLPDGQRQIMAYLVPGDFCDLHVAILGEMDHAIMTLSACTVVDIPQATVNDLTQNHPRIARALWWATLVDEGTLREWLVNMGQRTADRQMAHLFCEMLVRLRAVGLASDGAYEFPLTQAELGDTLGLSTVHVNRMLQQLRDDDLIVFKGKTLTIIDPDRLIDYAGFTPNYLHLRAADQNGGRATRRQHR